MKLEIKVPQAGESVSQATVSQIMKNTGSFVKSDEEILELETDKVNQVLYAPGSGVLTLTVKVGDVVKVGEVIGAIDTQTEQKRAPSLEERQEKPKESPPKESIRQESGKQSLGRRMTTEYVEEIKTPPDRAVSKEEPAALEEVNQNPFKRRKMSGLRKVIASRLVAVKNQTAMLTTFNEVDMTQILEIRAREQEAFVKRYGVKLGFMSFFIKATVAALKKFPEVNSMIEGEDIITFLNYDVCIAVSTEKGLMVPVLKSCDQKSFGQIEQAIAEFAKKARSGTITVDDMRGGSFTITNGGVFGSMLSTPILNPPQSAILGMHTILRRPMVIDEQITIRPMMYLALSYDHRIIDGKEAIEFLVQIKKDLEEPTRMLIDL